MHELQEIVAGLRPQPTRALLLAFDASPPFVDHVVLPTLLSDRLEDVTIIVDALSMRASTVDAGSTRKAGIYYRVTGVRPRGGGLFHPKLLCLVHKDGVHVLIGSANLTWSGWCRNLEIMDTLSFGPQGTAPRRAGLQVATFLRGCRDMLVGLGSADDAALIAAAEALEAAIGVTPEGSPEGPTCEVLHSLNEPLLGQLLQRAPEARVSSITVVSPFYDPTNQALVRFAAGYGKARIRVIKDGLRANDFDGTSFLRLGKRLRLYETAWEDEPSRPLHAKALLLQGNADAWVVVGSANLTSPAWLDAAKDGGNIELVAVRHARGAPPARPADLIGANMLFREVPSSPVKDPAGLAFKLDDQETNPQQPALHVIEAVERDQTVLLRWETTKQRLADTVVDVTLRSQDREVSKSFSAIQDGNGWRLEFDSAEQFARAVFDDEIAVIVRLRQRVDGVSLEGIAWLQRADLLGHQPQVLLWRHRLRALTSTSSTPEEVIDSIVALIEMSRSAQDAFREEHAESTRGIGLTSAAERNSAKSKRPSEAELLRGSLRALLRPRKSALAGRSSTAPTGGRAHVVAEEYDSDESDEFAPDDLDETSDDKPEDNSRSIRAELLASKCGELVAVARDYASRARYTAAGRDEQLEAVTSGVLLFGLHAVSLAVRQPWLIEHEGQSRAIRKARQDLWAIAFALEGWEAGQCEGWFPTMSTLPGWESLADTGLRSPEHLACLCVDLASCTILEGNAVISPETAFVLRMLASLDRFPSAGAIGRRAAELVAELVANDPRLSPDALSGVFAPAGIRDLEGWMQVEKWLPLLDFASGAIGREQLDASLTDSQRRALASLLQSPKARDKIATVRMDNNGALCGRCDTGLAIQASAAMLAEADTFSFCETCNRLIVPLDQETTIWRAVLAGDPERTRKRGNRL